tara:strand:+ start:89 stop:1648 length:1560 start_codon:yes stop_codon:yes gene_type:complete
MKKNYKKCIKNILLILMLTLFQNASFSKDDLNNLRDEKYACNLFYNKIANSDDLMARNLYQYHEETDFGFFPKPYYDDDKDEWFFLKDGTSMVVGHIYDNDTEFKLRTGTIIEKINGQNAADIIDAGWFDYIDEVETVELEIINLDKKREKVILEKKTRNWALVYHFITNFKITNIDIKKSTYDLNIENVFEERYNTKEYYSDEPHVITKIGLETLFIDDEKGFFAHICNPDPKLFDEILIDPAGVEYPDVIENDLDLEKNINKIWLYAKKEGYDEDEVNIQRSFKNNFKVSNNYNLRSFPFDKQNIKFRIVDDVYSLGTRIYEIAPFTFRVLDDFLKKDDIPGWNKRSAKISNIEVEKITNKDVLWSGLEIDVVLERKHGYYIYKVILPILLILSVCWSVVWVDPKELEARLTITIVCLLSLIAYNFVIDAELPKLEYLTVLDWVVLISYFYATVPNFLSIISFRLQKTNIKMSNKIELMSKRYGLSSYVLSIIIIVWINAYSNPENSSSLISWMAGR